MKKILTEEEAITLLIEGSEKAFEFLFNRYYHKVFNFVSLNFTNSQIAEDITQNVFFKLWENRERLISQKGVEDLLFIMARNQVYNQTNQQIVRDLYHQKIFKEMLEMDIFPESNIETSLNAKLLLELIDKWIDELPEKRKKIFLMSRQENMETKEIAQKLGLSTKTVETQIRRTIQFLKRKMDCISCFLL